MHQQFDRRIEVLRKDILTVEYDLPNIKNDNLKSHKQFMLKLYKQELERLLKNKPKVN